jgi:hypothetical protein
MARTWRALLSASLISSLRGGGGPAAEDGELRTSSMFLFFCLSWAASATSMCLASWGLPLVTVLLMLVVPPVAAIEQAEYNTYGNVLLHCKHLQR